MVVTLYYATWCPACTRFKDTWTCIKDKGSSSLTNVTFEEKDIDQDSNGDEMREYGGTTIPFLVAKGSENTNTKILDNADCDSVIQEIQNFQMDV